MTSITQTISSFTGGISQQPDALKVPGQVTEAKNVLPDITTGGLLKRPGGQLVKSLSDGTNNSYTTGRWFHYYRDETEQYIGQIIRRNGHADDGKVRMWRCSDGVEMHVENLSSQNSSLLSYLQHSTDEDLQTLTLNDYTYVTNRTKTVAMKALSSGDNDLRPPEAFIELKKVAYASQYAINLFDTIATAEVKTATRIKVASSSLNSDSSCPNVGTEIFKVGTGDQDLTTSKQYFKFSLLAVCQNAEDQFFENDENATYTLVYIPPAWTTNTYYSQGDLVLGESDNSRIYKRTGSAITSSGSVPSHDSGESGGWSVITSTTYSATSDVASTQLYNGQPCIEVSTQEQINSASALTQLTTEFTAGNANFPFELNDTDYNTSGSSITYKWKIEGDYSDQISRIILRKTTGNNNNEKYTIGGNNVSSAADGALSTNRGRLDITSYGFAAHNVLPAGRADLYFRLTNTGQAVPDTTGDNYSCRYTTTVDLLHGGSGWEPGDKIQIRMKDGIHVIEVEETSISKVQANLGLIRPNPTSFDTKTTVTAESILGSLRTAILGTNNSGENTLFQWDDDSADEGTNNYNGYQVKQVGNGLYITRPSNIQNGVEQNTFNINTPVGELLNVLTESVKDVTELPNQCKHGYIVKVANSEAEEDDYYLKFFGDNDRDGTGVWEECVKPGVEIQYDPTKLPIQIVRQNSTTADGSGNTHANGWFKISQIDWENALVGDTAVEGTNPRASFVGKTINKMMFWRNRLIMLSDENIIMSQAGEFYNFWAKTALTSTATDVIDISCSSEYPAIIYDGISTNSGLVLFTKNQQFLLSTDSDVLSPLTAKVNSISSYNFNHTTNPVSIGTTIAFLDNAGKYSRLWEMAQVAREGEPSVLDQSKVVSQLLSTNVTQISNSKENGALFFSEKGTSTLFGYRYFSVAGERIQQAWFTWELQGTIQTHCVLDDALYVVVRNNAKDQMLRFDLKRETTTDLITSGTDEFRIHLDNSETVTIAANAYNSTTDKTTFSKPTGFEGSGQLAIIEDNGTNITRYAEVTVNGSNLEITGDWSNGTYFLGYLFDMQVEFPRFYIKKTEGTKTTSDTRSSLVLHRVKLNLGSSGLYKTILKRIGKPDYEELHESPLSDNYDANAAAFYTEASKTIPIYDRNINTTLILKSTHPSPATLHSMTWEGDWTDRYYKNV